MKLEADDTCPSVEVRTNVDFVVHVENTLGFMLDTTKPAWRARQIEAGKLKRKRKTDPQRFSIENLLLAVEYLRRRKREVASPAAICWFVDEAMENVHSEPVATSLDAEIRAAISEAQQEGAEEWAQRLIRARGPARADVLEEWRQRG